MALAAKTVIKPMLLIKSNNYKLEHNQKNNIGALTPGLVCSNIMFVCVLLFLDFFVFGGGFIVVSMVLACLLRNHWFFIGCSLAFIGFSFFLKEIIVCSFVFFGFSLVFCCFSLASFGLSLDLLVSLRAYLIL